MHFTLGALALIAMWGAMPYLIKKIARDTSSIEMLMFMSALVLTVIMAIVVLMLPCTYRGGRVAEFATFFQRVSWWQLVLWTFVAFVATTMVYYMLLREHPAYKVVSVTSVFPLVTVLLGYAVFKEQITRQEMVGAAVIVAGLVIMNAGVKHS